MSFRGVFITVFLGTALLVAAFMVNARRPHRRSGTRPRPWCGATGKCAECHRQETSAIVHEFEMSRHTAKGVNCLECHQRDRGPGEARPPRLHHREAGHGGQLQAVPRDRVPAVPPQPPRGAGLGGGGRARATSPRSRSPSPRSSTRVRSTAPRCRHGDGGAGGRDVGCLKCHGVGKPNADGSIGSCTACHARHVDLGGAGPDPRDLRPVPHGAGPLAARDLPRVQARRPVQRPEGRA